MAIYVRTVTYGPISLGKKISAEGDTFINGILGEIQREGCKIREIKVVPAISTSTIMYYTYLIIYES